MLAIPIHKSDPCDLNEALQSFVFVRSTGESVLQELKSDIQLYINLRAHVVQIEDPTLENLNDMLRFHSLMKHMAPRLEDYINSADLAIKFSWSDAFRPANKAIWKSIYFDWANALWNFGACASRVAARQNRQTEDGLREANKHFQLAAGVFDFIQVHLLPKLNNSIAHGSATVNGGAAALPCLTNDCLMFAKTLNLAQAQQCFYEKAVNDKKNGTMKSAIIAKLAAQTSQLYSTGSTYCKVGIIGSVLGNIKRILYIANIK